MVLFHETSAILVCVTYPHVLWSYCYYCFIKPHLFKEIVMNMTSEF
jgi:hypothetical protein